MGLFKKKADPLSERAKQLNAQIASLESEIKQLTHRLGPSAAEGPRLRSTVTPGASIAAPASQSPPPEPIFEDIDSRRIQVAPEAETTAAHYNELGVRKYDLVALFKRWRNHFQGPAANNPKLINYLAAGSIQGLKPLRYEKRVARNRFFALFVVLLIVLLGLFTAVFRNH
ncbi:MAG: hypothetical protein AB1705_12050 [Verrucomicrobiota bacterium]